MKKNEETKKILVFTFIGVIVSTAFYETCIELELSWITPAYIVLGCLALCVYVVMMKGIITPPSKTVFSDELLEEERKKLADEHAERFRIAKPFLLIAAVILFTLLIDYCIYLVCVAADRFSRNAS